MLQEDWMLSEEQWRAMKPLERFLHCVEVAAYFIYLDHRERNLPDTPALNWDSALLEISVRDDIPFHLPTDPRPESDLI